MAYDSDTEKEKKPKVPVKPRPGEGTMEDEELRLLLESVLGDAEDYVDDELEPARTKATDFYKVRPLGNEEEGRSQFQLSEVRDAVRGMMPSLLRVFTGPDHVVEFVPRRKEGVELARKMTDAVRAKFELNNGFLKLHDLLLDGLIRKIGIFAWGWDERKVTSEEDVSGLTMEELNAIAAEDDVEVEDVKEDGGSRQTQPILTPQGPQPGPKEKTFKARVIRTKDAGEVWFEAIPPSELIMSRAARRPDNALYIGRRKKVTRGELLEMGYSDDDIDEHMSLGKLQANEGADARNPEENNGDPEAGEENDEAVYHEGYLRFDYDGRGYATYRVCALGSNYHPLHVERADEVKLAVWSPFPEPHTLVGDSVADATSDLQMLGTALIRGILDSLSASIFPRTAYIEGQVNPEDILNTDIGAPIRVKNTSSLANAIMPITVPFAGREGLALLEYKDAIRESRTGRNKGPDGLDADALQSTEKAAAKAAVTASQMSTEMVARMAAEMALKPLFRGLMREMVRHRQDAYMAKLRNEWVEVIPSSWDADLEVQVNIALGSGTVESKLANLDKIISRQTALVTGAPDNPIASWVELYNALSTEAEVLGYRDTERFYKRVTPEVMQQMEQAKAQQPPPPSPEQMLAEGQIKAKQLEVEGKLAIERDRLNLEERKMLLQDDRERDKIESNNILTRMKIEAEYSVKLNQMEIDAAIERDRSARDTRQESEDAVQAEHDRQLEREQMAHDKEMAGVDAAIRMHEATIPEPEADTLTSGAEGVE